MHLENKCPYAPRDLEGKGPEFIRQSRGLQIEKDQTIPTSSSEPDTRSTGETGHILFTDINSWNDSHGRLGDEPINN